MSPATGPCSAPPGRSRSGPGCSSGRTRGRTWAPAATPTRWSARTPTPAWNGRGSSTWCRPPNSKRRWATARWPATLAAEALRIAAWRPRLGAETDDKTIPHELDLLRTAVHLAKGCYKGQETIARVHNLGHPPRRLVFLQLDGSQHTLPAPGSEVLPASARSGTVTSVAQHYEMGPVALAVIKRSVAPDEVLTVLDGEEPYTAAQEVIVAPDAGQVVGRQTGFLRGTR